MSADPPVDDTASATRRWADNWKRVAPILEAERWTRLAAMSDAERAVMAVELLSLYQPHRSGDDGEGLLAIQRVFARWPRPR